MSGFKLRALLEDGDFTSALQQPNSFIDKQFGNDVTLKKSKLDFNAVNRPSSALLNGNLWDDVSGSGDDDFNLEYMDLDEFLSETGLVDTNFTNMLTSSVSEPSPPSSQSVAPIVEEMTTKQPSSLEELLAQTPDISAPSPSGSSNSATNCVVPVKEVLPQMNSDAEQMSSADKTTDDDSTSAKSAAVADVGLVKKRKYKEDGEGLTDTSVVVVPGKDGFDPAQAKFDPEELQPQPIIKKSKKQFVAEENKDEKYWRRRNKNNVAAKRSREARRAKENQIIMRAGFLENENQRLVKENDELLQENKELKSLLEKLQARLK